MLLTTVVAVIMTATWLALGAFGSAPHTRANAPTATKPVALAESRAAAVHVTEPSPIASQSVVPLPTAAPSIVPVPVAAAPEFAPLSSIALTTASLPPDTATLEVAPLPPIAPKFGSAPLRAATSVSVPPPLSKSASRSPNTFRLNAVPLPPRRPADLTESHPAPRVQITEIVIEKAKRLVEHGRDVVILLDSITRLGRAYNTVPSSGKVLTGGVDAVRAEAARALGADLSAPTVEPNPDAPPGETTVQQTIASSPAPAAPAQSDSRDIFQRIFDALILAFAPSAGTAVYDIAAHTVYMPNGERLEAHSGLGRNLDDPRSMSQKNRGVLPAQTYALRLRKQLFHGVAALRLDPVGDGNMYGRVGMLAHTYMRGPRGDSSGCVSFKDYGKFLTAYQRGEVSRLVVVTHGGATPWSGASVADLLEPPADTSGLPISQSLPIATRRADK
jgi:hypothetical protein